MPATPRYFTSAAEFRDWLRKNHKSADELIVGYHKKHTDRPSLTWAESVAEALCYGWIDGVRRRVDEDRYTIRFTPRRPGSMWSAINVKLMAELEAAGKMTAAGLAAFAARRDPTDPGYSRDRMNGKLDAARLKAFKKNTSAWTFFEAQPPGYRRLLTHWIMAAKRDETRDRRLLKVIDASKAKIRLGW